MGTRSKAGTSAAAKAALADIKPLLGQSGVEDAIADRAREAGEAAVYDWLLEDTELVENKQRGHMDRLPRPPAQDLVPGKRLKAKDGRLLARRHLARRLVAEAPESSMVASRLRAAIRSLVVEGADFDWRRPRGIRFTKLEGYPVVLSPLAKFENLSELYLDCDTNDHPYVPAPELLGPLRSLRLLRTPSLGSGERAPADLRFLAGAEALEELDVGDVRSLAGVDALPRLRALVFRTSDPIGDLDALRGHPSLEELVLGVSPHALVRWVGQPVVPSDLAALSALLDTLPRLRSLELEAPCPDFVGLALPRLRTLRLHGKVEVFDGAGLPALEHLELGAAVLRELVPPRALVSVSLRAVPRGLDLSSLAALPTLRAVRIGAESEEELGFLDRCTRLCSLEAAPFTDASRLSGHLELEHVELRGVTDAAPIAHLPRLRWAHLAQNVTGRQPHWWRSGSLDVLSEDYASHLSLRERFRALSSALVRGDEAAVAAACAPDPTALLLYAILFMDHVDEDRSADLRVDRVVSSLLAAGADALSEIDGATPLAHAVRHAAAPWLGEHHVRAIALLVEAGADPSGPTPHAYQPSILASAEARGMARVLAALRGSL